MLGDIFRPLESLNGANIRLIFHSCKQIGKILRGFKKKGARNRAPIYAYLKN